MEHTVYYHIKKEDDGVTFQFIGLNEFTANTTNRKFVELDEKDFTEKKNKEYGMLFATPEINTSKAHTA